MYLHISVSWTRLRGILLLSCSYLQPVPLSMFLQICLLKTAVWQLLHLPHLSYHHVLSSEIQFNFPLNSSVTAFTLVYFDSLVLYCFLSTWNIYLLPSSQINLILLRIQLKLYFLVKTSWQLTFIVQSSFVTPPCTFTL